jgi:SAM-dependent methyltransferase
VTAVSRWGARAAALYGDAYARRYREHDDSLRDGALVRRFGRWLGAVCDACGQDLDVLDLGCGTGRYFHALRGVRRLTGIDISKPMLERARTPVDADAITVRTITLIEADFLDYDFGEARFDLVYSVGVLAEHSPFDDAVAARVHRCLKPGGRFAFTAVHPQSFSVPRTMKRAVAERLLPVTSGRLRQRLRARLMWGGLYADEERIREVLEGTRFEIESLDDFQSDVHRHCLAVARKPA